MLRSLAKLTWLEIKIFVREPLGLVGAIAIPVAVFLFLGRMLGGDDPSAGPGSFVRVEAPVFAALLILLSAVLSLVTIVAIYREGGILKRLRATPLRPFTILTAQVLVKVLLTMTTLGLMVLAGRRYYPVVYDVPVIAFTAALVISSISILSMGFVIASLVPTARFAQPIGAAILYPMVALSGLFIPIDALPAGLRLVARLLPMTYAVSLMKGIWIGDPWPMHAGDIAALAIATVVCIVLSTQLFRWE
ncbi:MAG TPA: ABC transporter permease [Vicinamibacterales bacterium]|jgi:ABC-2 type transport system permease protein